MPTHEPLPQVTPQRTQAKPDAQPAPAPTSQAFPIYGAGPDRMLQMQRTVGNRVVQRDGPQNPAAAQPAPAAAAGQNAGNSALRSELLKLFDEYDKKIVGDTEFDKVISKEAWDKKKKEEADATAEYNTKKAQYDEDLKKFKAGELTTKPTLPIPVAKYTTCIDTQRVLLSEALKRSGETIKPAGASQTTAFGTTAQQTAGKIGDDVWHTATENMPKDQRPKPGDIIILGKRGDKVDKAALEAAFTRGELKKAQATDQAAEAGASSAEGAFNEAKAALEALSSQTEPADAAEQAKAKTAVQKALTALTAAKAAAVKATAGLTKATGQADKSQEKLDTARDQQDHTKYFEFSHVGYLKELKVNDDKTETWTTFDGGQNVGARGGAQGAQSGARRYDPTTNEIAGEASQGGAGRWLQGWVDVDKLPK